VPLLQAFKSPERSKKPSANFAPFQSKSSYLQAAEQSDFVSARVERAVSWPVCNESRSWQRTETSSRRQRSKACCFGKLR
jgi:hypothetical protein